MTKPGWRPAAIGLAVLAMAGGAHAQTKPETEKPKDPPESTSGWSDTRKRAVEIGSQPARDVGMSRREIPPILEAALVSPYGLAGLKTCAQLAGEVRKLNAALGPDYTTANEYKENRAGKLAQAGGRTVVNSFIPFRGLVREITGAAPADRHMDAVVDAGLARRGFLRGVHYKQRCKTAF